MRMMNKLGGRELQMGICQMALLLYFPLGY